MKKPVVYFIVGPTACGKTDAAVFAASEMNGEVVSADSIQIYRRLDKGSAKPTADEMNGIKHHLINVIDYKNEDYSAACFARDAKAAIDEIVGAGKTPIVAGGTGLYVNALLYPLNFTEVLPDIELREKLNRIEMENPGILHKRLSEVDPKSAERLHPNDTKRLIRALEVYERTGKTLTEQGGDFLNSLKNEIDIEPVIAGINMDRSLLYDRINKRVDLMIRNGLCDEAFELYNEAGRKQVLSLQAIGYKQFISYFEGEATFDETVSLIKRDTRRFAKRQIAWFKRDDRIKWFDYGDFSTKDELNRAIVRYFTEEKERIEREG